MLTVKPMLQGHGLGRFLIHAAEAHAKTKFAATSMEMTVFSARKELLAWYGRRGFAPTGETRPFVKDLTRDDLTFIVLEKKLSE